jgi:uncharacterized protein
MKTMNIQNAKKFLVEKEERRRRVKEKTCNAVISMLKNEAGIFKKYNVHRAYLYGSIRNGNIHADSDVDIAVEGDMDFSDILKMHTDLSKTLDRTVDVRQLDELPFSAKVKEKGLVIYERETASPQK